MKRTVISISALVLGATSALAQLRPGDAFREYKWRPRTKWQRVTGPDATSSGARQFLPNPVNTIDLPDLYRAYRCDVYLEKLTSHGGTNLPRMRINKNSWLTIPDPDPNVIPGKWGRGPRTIEYLLMHYPIVSIPMKHLRQGRNTFEFTCQGRGGVGLGKVWPQWLLYGVTFRIYYDKRTHPTGFVKSHRDGAELRENPVFEVAVNSSRSIRQVDLIGNYDDFNWRGDGLDGQWQYHYHYGAIRKHIGTATKAPYRVRWDTTWIPTQPRPFSVVARIVDSTGMNFITPAVTNLTLRRSKTVVRYRSFNISKKWQSQKYTPYHSCDNNVTGDLSKASAARLFLTTWNGYEAQNLGMNGQRLVSRIGKNHDLDYNTIDIATSRIRRGKNTFYTRSTTSHHGIEIQWPGIELFVRYDTPESWPHFVPFGKGCNGSAGVPVLSGSGVPGLGRTFTWTLTKARANAPVALMAGASRDQWGSLRLPIDLTAAGARGCWLHVTPDLATPFVADGNGNARLSWRVPNESRLVGVRFFNQGFVYEPTVNRLKWILSNGGAATIGR